MNKDWEHPLILIDSNPKIPSRGRHLELGETDPVPFIREGIAALIQSGAQILALPCNTAHIFYQRYSQGFEADIPSIVEVTADACQKAGIKKALVLASRLTINHSLYQKALEAREIDIIIPDDEGQKLVSCGIETVKQGSLDKAIAESLNELVRNSRAEAVILGCTELPVLINKDTVGNEIWVVDSNLELARYCLEAARGKALKSGGL